MNTENIDAPAEQPAPGVEREGTPEAEIPVGPTAEAMKEGALLYAGVQEPGIPEIPEEVDEEIELFEPPAGMPIEINVPDQPLLSDIPEKP